MKNLTVLITLIALVSVSAFADTINVPADYATVVDAVANSVSGDTILIQPGVYDEAKGLDVPEDVNIEGAGEYPSEVTIKLPRISSQCVFTNGDLRIINLTIRQKDTVTRVIALEDSVLELQDVVFENVQGSLVAVYGEGALEMSHCTVLGTEGTYQCITCTDLATVSVSNSIIVDFPRAFSDNVDYHHNLYWSVDEVCKECQPDKTDIIADPMLDSTTHVPLPGSPAIDSGDGLDPDGTNKERGAVRRYPFINTIAFEPFGELPNMINSGGETVFNTGDQFTLYRAAWKDHGLPVQAEPVPVNLYVALSYGDQFFWFPTWTEDVNYSTQAMMDGATNSEIVLQFIVPDSLANLSGFAFYAIGQNPDGSFDPGTLSVINVSFGD